MKKFLTVILAVLYLSTSMGATVHMHYCMGKLADWGLGHNKSKTCGECGMEKKNAEEDGCCKDEQKFIKNDTDQKINESSFQLMEVMGSALLPTYTHLPSVQISTVTEENPLSNAPPRSSSIAVYILKRSFLI
ncbi:HYC_CC_PP family protein [Terrimonas pollutisoli]|uniref:HYC_CC_PP family protein n=1 Tax=Terrimonas pollutisoli TaxID=3034147 RepID=UPI0023EB4200|nr:hypothetical protein [Terrimonas sp. H1YJ31]